MVIDEWPNSCLTNCKLAPLLTSRSAHVWRNEWTDNAGSSLAACWNAYVILWFAELT